MTPSTPKQSDAERKENERKKRKNLTRLKFLEVDLHFSFFYI